MIRAAIVGLGRWGQNLVNSVRDSQTLQFTLAHSRHRETAETFCGSAGLRWVGSLDAVLDDPAIDAAVFATPHSQHTDQVSRAAAAGKHVFVEKPFSLSAADARRSLDAARRARIVLAVGFNRRFHPSMVQLRSAMRAGRLGVPVTISAEQTALHGLSLTQDAWGAQAHESPVGAMTAIGVHLVDGMIDLMGKVAWVYASVARRAAPYSDDTTDVLLRFVNGASGHIVCSTAATPNYRMAVYGTGGFAEILGQPMATFRLVPSGGGERLGTAAPEVLETPIFNMLTSELEEFASKIAEKRAFATPLDQTLHGVAVFEAVARSAASGRAESIVSESAHVR